MGNRTNHEEDKSGDPIQKRETYIDDPQVASESISQLDASLREEQDKVLSRLASAITELSKGSRMVAEQDVLSDQERLEVAAGVANAARESVSEIERIMNTTDDEDYKQELEASKLLFTKEKEDMDKYMAANGGEEKTSGTGARGKYNTLYNQAKNRSGFDRKF